MAPACSRSPRPHPPWARRGRRPGLRPEESFWLDVAGTEGSPRGACLWPLGCVKRVLSLESLAPGLAGGAPGPLLL